MFVISYILIVSGSWWRARTRWRDRRAGRDGKYCHWDIWNLGCRATWPLNENEINLASLWKNCSWVTGQRWFTLGKLPSLGSLTVVIQKQCREANERKRFLKDIAVINRCYFSFLQGSIGPTGLFGAKVSFIWFWFYNITKTPRKLG